MCTKIDLGTKIRFTKNYVGRLYCISEASLDMQLNIFVKKCVVLENTV